MQILAHNFNKKMIEQLSEDIVIGGHLIPKGYVNATQMCKANGKRLEKYFEFSKTQPFLDALKAILSRRSPSQGEREIAPTDLVIVIQGGKPEYQGTWVHPNVSMHLAQWVSPEFAAWASTVLLAIVTNDYAPLTAEAEEAMRKVQSIYAELRSLTVEVRNTWTDDILADHKAKHPDEPVTARVFIEPSDALNLLLTGHRAAYWVKRFECDPNKLRDRWGVKQLRRIVNVEELASAKVANEGMSYVEAVKSAAAAFHYKVWTEDELIGKGDRKTYERNHKRKTRAVK